MKRVLLTLIVLFSLGLCALCVYQWKREHDFRALISELSADLLEENKMRVEAEAQVEDYRKEIERLNRIRADIEASLLAATEQVENLIKDQSARGYSIAILMNQVLQATGGLEAYKALADKGSDAIKQRNEEVAAQNSAIEKANAQLKQLVSERDSAISKLNSKIREFNELTEKYNKLARDR